MRRRLDKRQEKSKQNRAEQVNNHTQRTLGEKWSLNMPSDLLETDPVIGLKSGLPPFLCKHQPTTAYTGRPLSRRQTRALEAELYKEMVSEAMLPWLLLGKSLISLSSQPQNAATAVASRLSVFLLLLFRIPDSEIGQVRGATVWSGIPNSSLRK